MTPKPCKENSRPSKTRTMPRTNTMGLFMFDDLR